MVTLRRYWFPSQNSWGIGVTAFSEWEATNLATQVATAMKWALAPSPPIVDVDVSTLEANHVRPNMGVPSERGVWFPLGFAHLRAGT